MRDEERSEVKGRKGKKGAERTKQKKEGMGERCEVARDHILGGVRGGVRRAEIMLVHSTD